MTTQQPEQQPEQAPEQQPQQAPAEQQPAEDTQPVELVDGAELDPAAEPGRAEADDPPGAH